MLDELFTRDCIRDGPDFEAGAFRGVDGYKQLVSVYRTAMSNLQVPAETIVGSGNIVVAYWTGTGTNDGPVLGNSPTGKSCKVFGFWMHRFEGNRIAEEWATWDTHGFLQQIGQLSPAPTT